MGNRTIRQGLWLVDLKVFCVYAFPKLTKKMNKGYFMTQKHLVYLAGPITGTTYSGCTDWRQWVMDKLPENMIGISPMRHKKYLDGGEEFDGIADTYDTVLSCQRGIFARDSWDCRRCDAILVNLIGAEKVSIGTVMEIAWGHAFHKPIILVMEPESNVHEHAMLREACPFRVDTMDAGIEVLHALFVEADH
jgi:nucleoside 2-deoxyribosyltransferase